MNIVVNILAVIGAIAVFIASLAAIGKFSERRMIREIKRNKLRAALDNIFLDDPTWIWNSSKEEIKAAFVDYLTKEAL
jgi:hypothetical protein